MHAPVTTALRSILMEEGRVCLPGIGTLLVVQQPALVSLIEGRASAPAARVSFNANLVVDDGRLARQVSNPDEVEQFLRQTRQSLDAGRTVLLEGVGKLFRHPDGEIRFTPGGDNFSKESFGLPTLEVRPIVRKEKTPEEPPRRRPKPVRQLQGSEFGRRYGSAAWYAAVLVGILTVIFLLFRLAGTISEEFGKQDPASVPRERLNVAPPTPRPAAPTIDANEVQPAPPPRINESPGTDPEMDEVTAPAPPAAAAPTQNVAIIAIGLFGRQRNVDKQTRRLSEAGYTPYTDQEGRNTRVGVRVTYDEVEELNRVLREIRARYTEDAFVMRVNGEDRRPR
ncbi:cell division septation protein DedD [Lewinella marina]|uniref:CCDC81-like prokaryotic HU domain-containing protein n=1 Tax=Neolewinella marina TaxID=438751 RepID=A0A2G0CHP8_9BACT|nr:hypothetical protein [Neolewinella marina]NJB85383.1 cell division septation protein DedD [Neolewinella marina]PHK99504.1 hypothetical protein CGL56_00130 [Neolewinella marina]